jgi:hypothetical protein
LQEDEDPKKTDEDTSKVEGKVEGKGKKKQRSPTVVEINNKR